MNTKQIIEQMEKEFDGKFEITRYDNVVVEPVKNIKSFIHSYTRTLLESFGEEIIGKDEDDSNYCRDQNGHYPREHIVKAQKSLRAEQRLKVKEILRGVGK